MIIFSPSLPEKLLLSKDPQIFANSASVLNISYSLVIKSHNTRRTAHVLAYKCNEKGGPFFKNPLGVKHREFTHGNPMSTDLIELTRPRSKD